MPVSYGTAGLLSGLGNLANGIQTGYLTALNAQNIKHQMKMGELAQGVQHNSDTDELEYTPEKQAQINLGLMKTQQDQQGYDANSDISQKLGAARGKFLHAANSNIPENLYDGMSEYEQEKLEGLAKPEISGAYGMLGKSAMADIMGQKVGVMQDSLAFNKHKTAVKEVIDDKPTQQLTAGIQSIQNALTNFKASGGMPQEFAQLQTQLRLNAGQGAARTGVNERAEAYARDLGIKKAEALQLITGNIQDVDASSPKLVNAIEQIAENEIKQKQQQGLQQIEKKRSSMSSIYNKPGMAQYKSDFDNSVDNQKQQLGLVNGQSSGQKQDPNIVDYAKRFNLDYSHAEQILKARGYNGQ